MIGMNKVRQDALDNIDKYGCNVTHVFQNGLVQPSFTYTTGIFKCTGKPELIITGLNPNVAHFVCNYYCKRIQSGKTFETSTFYNGFIEGFDVMFKKMRKTRYDNWLGLSNWFYEGEHFDVYQMIYPDVDGTFHWDDRASEELKFLLPELYND